MGGRGAIAEVGLIPASALPGLVVLDGHRSGIDWGRRCSSFRLVCCIRNVSCREVGWGVAPATRALEVFGASVLSGAWGWGRGRGEIAEIG